MNRRQILGGLGAALATPLATPALAGLSGWGATVDWRISRTLKLYNPATDERFSGEYRYQGLDLDDARHEIAHIFRDKRTDQVKPIDINLIDTLASMQDALDGREILILSGFRSRESNNRLRGAGAARNSFHIHGKAADIRVERVGTRTLSRLGDKFGAGGIGRYRSRGFVHLDTGPNRRWNG